MRRKLDYFETESIITIIGLAAAGLTTGGLSGLGAATLLKHSGNLVKGFGITTAAGLAGGPWLGMAAKVGYDLNNYEKDKRMDAEDDDFFNDDFFEDDIEEQSVEESAEKVESEVI